MEVIEAPKVGRKPKFDKSHCNLIVEMAKEGKSLSHFIAFVGISKTAYYKWVEKHESFKEATDLAEETRKAYYDQLLFQAALGDPALLYYKDEEGKVRRREFNPDLIKTLYNRYNGVSNSGIKNSQPVINVNIDNTTKSKELTVEERQERLEILKDKLRQGEANNNES